MIGVVDYGAGNLRNVQAALARLGAPWRSVAAPDDLDGLVGLILPGVGQFGAAARRLREAGLDGALRGWIREDRPFLGICLGMQLLFESSEEERDSRGLGALEGRVTRLQAERLPHIGWAVVEPLREAAGSMFEMLPGDGFFAYFAHSFALPAPSPAAVAHTTCPPSFVSAVRSGRVWGTQFHPEKSGAEGQRILANFIAGAGAAREGAR